MRDPFIILIYLRASTCPTANINFCAGLLATHRFVRLTGGSEKAELCQIAFHCLNFFHVLTWIEAYLLNNYANCPLLLLFWLQHSAQ
jgi:hypothetical protein